MSVVAKTRLRLAVRDLSAAAAFAAMAASRAVPIWAIALFVVGLGLALLNYRIVAERGALTLLILGASLLVLYSAVAAEKLDLVLAACTFATLITLLRMLARSTAATDNQVHLTSLLMMAGAAALSADLLFVVFLAVYGVLTTLSLGLGNLESASAPDEPLVLRQVVRQLLLGAAFAMVGSVVFFAAFPRLSWNVAARRASTGFGAPVTGLADRVRLGGNGAIKTNPRVVARIRLHPDPATRSLNGYWFARAFDLFNGKEWSTRDPGLQPRWQLVLRKHKKKSVRQEVELLPAYGSQTAFALEEPAVFGNARAFSSTGALPVRFIQLGEGAVRLGGAASGYIYWAESVPSGTEPDSGDDEARAKDYLELPPGLDPRVADLATRIVAGESDPARAASKLENYLKTRYQYTLTLAEGSSDPLADFLFARQAGHCEDFANALTIMLRTQHIPARIAIGFYGGERIGDLYVIRAGDAHAWTQALLPHRGFVSFDATPESNRAGSPSPWLDWITRVYEAIDMKWRSSVVDYSIQDQTHLARSIHLPKVPRLALPVLGLLVLTTAAWRRLRRRRKREHEATALLSRIERTLVRASLSAGEGEDLEGFSKRLTSERHPIHHPLAQATERYLDARFGHRPLRPGEAQHIVTKLKRALAAQRAYVSRHRPDPPLPQGEGRGEGN